MMKLNIPYRAGTETTDITMYLGHPTSGLHPLKFQAAWFHAWYGGEPSQSIMADIAELGKLAVERKITPERLWQQMVNESKDQ